MKKNEVKVGGLYIARIGQNLTVVRLDSATTRGWQATNLRTNKQVSIKSAQKLRREATDCDVERARRGWAAQPIAPTHPLPETQAVAREAVVAEPIYDPPLLSPTATPQPNQEATADPRAITLHLSAMQVEALGDLLQEVSEDHDGYLRCIEEDRAARHNHVSEGNADAHALIDRECNAEMAEAINRYEMARELLEVLL